MQEKKSSSISDSIAVGETESFATLVSDIRACKICRDRPRYGLALSHEPRPIIQASETACICIASQAPGTRVHESGLPFSDPSGARLKQWLGLNENEFYDSSKIAILPMGFCFPGLNLGRGDLPPRRECSESWRMKLFARLPNLKLLLVIGIHAQRWHFGSAIARQNLTEIVRSWRQLYRADPSIRRFPLPHPSWHNNSWLKCNPWFEEDLLPVLRADIRSLLS